MTSVATPSRPEAQAPLRATPPDWLRGAVRSVLLGTPAYQELDPVQRRELAQAMVKVGQLAADCIAEERAAQAQIDARPVARALQDPGFGESASRMAQVTRDTLEAISFPRFVTDLLNGVFRAMNDSSQAQLQQYLQLLNAVSSTAGGFEQTQTNEVQVRAWLVDHFPASFEMDLPEPPEPGEEPPDPEDVEPPRLRLKAGGSMPSEEALRAALGVQEGEEFSAGGNPEALVPLARRQLARQRQGMLATMVQMGDAAHRDRFRPHQRRHALPHRHAQRRHARPRQPVRHAEPGARQRQLRHGRLGRERRRGEHHLLRQHRSLADHRGDEHQRGPDLLGRTELPHRRHPAEPAGRAGAGRPRAQCEPQPGPRNRAGRGAQHQRADRGGTDLGGHAARRRGHGRARGTPPALSAEPLRPPPTTTPSPTPRPTPTPTPAPTGTPTPTPAPTGTPAPTPAPTGTPAPRSAPGATPRPTTAPAATPRPTTAPRR
ncbi:hypothetical protein [Ramlibacter montanisoli]|uniref:hypothetical protein n=1 Tax=Ramlibacter montanisoli TaxID=2732512 RepID=UPI001C0EF007|nr:hypothetical protein [Ramlibacter montanisoli]